MEKRPYTRGARVRVKKTWEQNKNVEFRNCKVITAQISDKEKKVTMAKYMFPVLVVAFCLSSVLARSYLGRRDRRLDLLDLANSQAAASASASSNTRGGHGSSSANAQASASSSTNGHGTSSANAQAFASSSTNGHGSSSANAQASAAAESNSQGNQCFNECESRDIYCYCSYDRFCESFVCRRSVNPNRPRIGSIRPHINRIRPRVPVCQRNTLSVLGACRSFNQCQYESDCPSSQTCCYDTTCGYNVCQYERRRELW
ncbi:hypothetical protein KUTeg_013680 [Tegillarca granosa]|uniref:WAP domain-containing protein n=1 Tax=Tegillarca granosa TaxID=220873 RepID=A0ABQ9EWW0_TEGGR|nr:hypothetical protein KUTeg_013680 [Tegillarca granosa]